ncbi:MAG: YtxH domain-containing protein [Ignavibacteriales bacterium]|nr:YtxH domain-containing protein [Ignavibacteriales bacterium]
MSFENDNKKSVFLGFLAGSVVGGIIALLFAPKSGKELRADIKVKANDIIEGTEEKIEKVKGKSKEVFNEAKVKGEKFMHDAKEKVEHLVKEAERIMKDAKEKAGDFIHSKKEKIVEEKDKLKGAVKAGVEAFKTEKEEK